MARAPKKTAPTKQETALAPWDEELAKFAEEAANSEKPSGGYKSISTRNGIMSIDDQPVPDSELNVVVLAAIYENQYFADDYDSNDTNVPACYAYGQGANAEEEMVPHEKVKEPQHDNCKDCPMNQWGSANKGRGKACKNVRRLAVVAEDALESAEAMEEAEVRSLKVSVTNTKNWSSYVRSKLLDLKLPPFAAVTKVKVQPDPKTQIKVTFSFVEAVDFKGTPGLYEAIKAKVKAATETLTQPYPDFDEAEEAKPAKRKLPLAKGGPRRRR